MMSISALLMHASLLSNEHPSSGMDPLSNRTGMHSARVLPPHSAWAATSLTSA